MQRLHRLSRLRLLRRLGVVVSRPGLDLRLGRGRHWCHWGRRILVVVLRRALRSLITGLRCPLVCTERKRG